MTSPHLLINESFEFRAFQLNLHVQYSISVMGIVPTYLVTYWTSLSHPFSTTPQCAVTLNLPRFSDVQS